MVGQQSPRARPETGDAVLLCLQASLAGRWRLCVTFAPTVQRDAGATPTRCPDQSGSGYRTLDKPRQIRPLVNVVCGG